MQTVNPVFSLHSPAQNDYPNSQSVVLAHRKTKMALYSNKNGTLLEQKWHFTRICRP